MIRYLLCTSLATLLLLSCGKPPANLNLSTVENLEVEKYMGTWYEIARFPHRFEDDLVGVTARYSLNEDGSIKVVNSGYKESFDGEFESVEGKAKVPDPEDPAKLKVSFFLFFYADYYVLELSPDYRYALIASTSENYLWILCRDPFMDDKTYDKLVQNAESRGFDVSKLEKIPQQEILD